MDERHIIFLLSSTAITLVASYGVLTFTIVIAIILSEKARSSPFNSYLLSVLVPNCITSVIFAILCSINVFVNDASWALCRFQSFVTIWHVTSTCWLFGIIGYELHLMLCCSLRCVRYKAPTRCRATRNVILVYVWGAVIATWSTFWDPAFPIEPSMQNDVMCIPLNYDRKTLLFLWLCLIPISSLIPYCYIGWLVWEIRRKALLPKKGQRRTISLFFFRIAIAYAVIVLPSALALCFNNKWVTWFAVFLGYSQVLVTALLSIQKPDIEVAVRKMYNRLFCRSSSTNLENDSSSKGNESKCNRTGSRLSIFSSSLTVSSQMNLPVSSKGNNPRSSITPFSGRISEVDTNHERSELDDLENEWSASEDALPSHIPQEEVYDDIPKQSELHYQFDDELDANNPDDVICFHIEEEEDESDLPVCPFGQ